MQKFGTGSALQQVIQAATTATEGLAGGSVAQAVSGAAAPYLAGVIKQTAPDETSRDTEHANGSIGPIFDKEKEQKRLQRVQAISEIGGQAADIARTQGIQIRKISLVQQPSLQMKH